jgi:hypothetical protein
MNIVVLTKTKEKWQKSLGKKKLEIAFYVHISSDARSKES